MYGPVYFWSGADPSDPGNYRMQIAQQWARPISFPFETPIPIYGRAAPMPMPLSLAPPDPVFAPEHWAPPLPSIRPAPKAPPYVQPSLDIIPPNRGGRPVLVRGGRHYRLPPKKRREEKKLLVLKRTALIAAGGKVFSVVTEALDITTAVWWALPKSARTPYASIAQKVKDIINGWDKIDWEQAVINLAKNELNDRAIAKRNRLVDNAAVKSGYWVSPRGPSASMRRIWEEIDAQ